MSQLTHKISYIENKIILLFRNTRYRIKYFRYLYDICLIYQISYTANKICYMVNKIYVK